MYILIGISEIFNEDPTIMGTILWRLNTVSIIETKLVDLISDETYISDWKYISQKPNYGGLYTYHGMT